MVVMRPLRPRSPAPHSCQPRLTPIRGERQPRPPTAKRSWSRGRGVVHHNAHMTAAMTLWDPTTLVDGPVFGEGATWRGDRRWFSDPDREAVQSVDLERRVETVVEVPGGGPA